MPRRPASSGRRFSRSSLQEGVDVRFADAPARPAAEVRADQLAVLWPSPDGLYQRPAITPRGTAYLRLAEFRNVWAGLGPEDRAYFAEDLRDLLVDAVLPETV